MHLPMIPLMRAITGLSRDRPFLFLFVVSLLLTIEYWILGPYSYTSLADGMDVIIPRNILLARDISAGLFSYNFRYTASGMDSLQNILFPPIDLLFVVFPYWVAYQIAYVLQILVALIGFFLLCRDVLRLRLWVCHFGAIMFAIYFCLDHHDQVLAFLSFSGFPLLLWGGHKILASKKPNQFLLFISLAGGFLFGFVSSLIVGIPFILPLLFAWLFWILPSKDMRRALICFISFALGMILSNIPAIYMYASSIGVEGFIHQRLNWTFQPPHWNAPLEQLSSYLQALTLGAKLPTMFSFLGILLMVVKKVGHKRLNGIFMKLIFVSFLCASSSAIFFAIYPFLREISFYPKGFEAGRFYEFMDFFWILAGTIALQHIFEFAEKHACFIKRELPYYLLAALLLVALDAKYHHIRVWVGYGNVKVNYNIAQLRELKAHAGSEPFRVATVVTGLKDGSYGTIFSEYVQAHGFETPGGLVNIYPQLYQDYWSEVIRPLAEQDEKVGTSIREWGCDLFLFSPKDIPPEGISFSNYYNLEKLSEANVRYIVSRKPLLHPKLELISQPHKAFPDWELLGQLDRIKILIRENFNGREIYIYRNNLALPRFYLLDKEERLNPSNKLTIKYYSADRIVVEGILNRRQTLVLANSYNPFWKARVDGQLKMTFAANGPFIGVDMPEGEHTVESPPIY